jgi:hypothetical protein
MFADVALWGVEFGRALGVLWIIAALMQAASTFLESAAAAGQKRRVAVGTADGENGRAARMLFSTLNGPAMMLLVVHAGFTGLHRNGVGILIPAALILLVITLGGGLGGDLGGKSGDIDITSLSLVVSMATFGVTVYMFMPTLLTLVQMF